MTYKLLQLNMFKGKYYDRLLDHLRKNQYDIICLQEVTGNKAGFVNNDNFFELKEKLGLNGELSINFNFPNDKSSYFGNAILYKKTLSPSNPREVWMNDFFETTNARINWTKTPRSCLFVDFDLEGKLISVGSTHMAWGPTPVDEPYKVAQGKILIDYVEQIPNSLILCGDFNVTPESVTIQNLSESFVNQTVKKGLTNTLDLRNHKIKNKKPQGLAVDYIFTSEDIKVKSFDLIDEEISDHHGLSLRFEV